MERVWNNNKSLQRPGQKRKFTKKYQDHIYNRIYIDSYIMYETFINKIDEAILKCSI